jgi:hypothetical protein
MNDAQNLQSATDGARRSCDEVEEATDVVAARVRSGIATCPILTVGLLPSIDGAIGGADGADELPLAVSYDHI